MFFFPSPQENTFPCDFPIQTSGETALNQHLTECGGSLLKGETCGAGGSTRLSKNLTDQPVSTIGEENKSKFQLLGEWHGDCWSG